MTLPSEFAIAKNSLERRLQIHTKYWMEHCYVCAKLPVKWCWWLCQYFRLWRNGNTTSVCHVLPNLLCNQLINFMAQKLPFHQWTVIQEIIAMVLRNSKAHNGSHKSLLYSHILMPPSTSTYFKLFIYIYIYIHILKNFLSAPGNCETATVNFNAQMWSFYRDASNACGTMDINCSTCCPGISFIFLMCLGCMFVSYASRMNDC
jgi:hypothetical protein